MNWEGFFFNESGMGIKSFLEIDMNPQICENSELGGNNVVLTLEIFFLPMMDEGANEDSILLW